MVTCNFWLVEREMLISHFKINTHQCLQGRPLFKANKMQISLSENLFHTTISTLHKNKFTYRINSLIFIE